MSPARRVIVGFDGAAVTPTLRDVLNRGVGGMILFSRNVDACRSLADVREVVRRVREAAGRPLLVLIDQEGGRVRRLRETHGFDPLPSMRAIGRSAEPIDFAAAAGRVLAAQCRAAGVNVCLAPVADVDSNPNNPVIGDRSFGPDPARVAACVAAAVKAMQAGGGVSGVAACAKHYPGHGDTDADSHHALPVLRHDASRLTAVELPPFHAALDAGVACVMTAHVLATALDADRPATLSVDALRPLRDAFGGVIVSDDLEMRAIADRYGTADAVRMGHDAGVDLFLVCHTPSRQHAAIDALERVEAEASLERVSALIGRFATDGGDAVSLPDIRADVSRLNRLGTASGGADPTMG